MDTTEIKFLLKLLAYQNHRTSISKIRLGSTVKAFVRNQVCTQLNKRGLIEFTEKVVKIKISAEGITALDEDSRRLTPLQLKVLKACQKKAISPSDTRVSAAQGRETLIKELAAKGLITVSTKINEVWLTDAGRKYLAEEYTPTGGGNIILNKKMLGDYLEFLRGYFSTAQPDEDVTPPSTALLPQDEKKDDNEIYQAIAYLDQERLCDNYLPIFYLRNRFPYITRDSLDQALYRLQFSGRIDFSTIAEVSAYTAEEIDAGIPQPVGGGLFYLSRTAQTLS